MHILTFTTLYPNALQPHFAVFVRARMEAFATRHEARLTVAAPIPWFPRLPEWIPPHLRKRLGRYGDLAEVPTLEEEGGYPVYHPRYLVIPKLFMGRYAKWMAAGTRRTLERIHRQQPIDLIDAHYVYPDGAAAVQLGHELGIPVVVSARGTDLNVFPAFPAIRRQIQATLAGCKTLICVSSDLRTKALDLGIEPEKTRVIGNGVDIDRFGPGDKAVARHRLGLDPRGKLILSVGNLIEGKGFHILIEALSGLRLQGARLYIAGQGSMRSVLESKADGLGLSDRVRFLGTVPNSELPWWYQAADVFALATAREGWPNVISEAQACGLPAVATPVSGIPDIVKDGSLGILVPERTPAAFRSALEDALSREWDATRIAQAGRSRSWAMVADEVLAVFESALARGR